MSEEAVRPPCGSGTGRLLGPAARLRARLHAARVGGARGRAGAVGAGAGSPRPLLGLLLLSRDASVTEACAFAGWDFVLIDCEHGLPDTGSVLDTIRAGEAMGLAVLARARLDQLATLTAWCDAGLAGVLLAGAATAEAAAQAVSLLRFAPEGERGLNPFVRAGRYGALAPDRLMHRGNKALSLWILVERGDPAAVAEVAAVSGVDCVFIGPYDLSVALGRPGEVDHPQVRAAVGEALIRARQGGVAAGVFAATPSLAAAYAAAGADVVVLGADLDVLRRRLADLRRQFEHRLQQKEWTASDRDARPEAGTAARGNQLKSEGESK